MAFRNKAPAAMAADTAIAEAMVGATPLVQGRKAMEPRRLQRQSRQPAVWPRRLVS